MTCLRESLTAIDANGVASGCRCRMLGLLQLKLEKQAAPLWRNLWRIRVLLFSKPRLGSEKTMFFIPFLFAREFIHVLECVIDPASVPTQYILPIAYCLYICCIYCLLLVACASVPVAAWLPDFVRSVATPCGVFCAPYPVVARRFSPRVQQARNSYSRPVRRSQKQG